MASNNLSFKTAFKKFLESPSDSQEHNKSNVLSDSNFDSSFQEQQEKQNRNSPMQKSKNTVKQMERVGNSNYQSKQMERVGNSNYQSKQMEQAENRNYQSKWMDQADNSSYRNNRFQDNGIHKNWLYSPVDESLILTKEAPAVQKSFPSKKRERTAAKKEINCECCGEKMSAKSGKCAILAEVEAEFAAAARFTMTIPKMNDYDGAGVDIFKDGGIYDIYLKLPQDLKDVVDLDPEVKKDIMIVERFRRNKRLQMEEQVRTEQKKQEEQARSERKKQMEQAMNEKKQMEKASNNISDESVKEQEKRNRNSPMQKSNNTVKQMERVDNSNYQSKQMAQAENSNYQSKWMDQVNNSSYRNKWLQNNGIHKNWQNKPVDESLILTKPKSSEKQMEPVNKKGKKKNKNRKEMNEVEMDLCNFTIGRSYKNIHSSGNKYAADEYKYLGPIKKQETMSARWERFHFTEQPRQDIVETPRWPTPPPVVFDEPPWDDDYHNQQQY